MTSSHDQDTLLRILEQQSAPLCMVPANDDNVFAIMRVRQKDVGKISSAYFELMKKVSAPEDVALEELEPAPSNDDDAPEIFDPFMDTESEAAAFRSELAQAYRTLGRLTYSRLRHLSELERKEGIEPPKDDNHYRRVARAFARVPDNTFTLFARANIPLSRSSVSTSMAGHCVSRHRSEVCKRLDRLKDAVALPMILENRSLKEVAAKLKTSTKSAGDRKKKLLKKIASREPLLSSQIRSDEFREWK